MKPARLITFSITLPECGNFDDYVDALREARQVQIDAGNLAAAQGLSIIVCLADGGNAYFKLSTVAPIIPKDEP